MKPRFTEGFLAGIQHFNALHFWEAHEAWEELWLHSSSEIRRFLQGLIQVAAAYHHLKRGTFPGAVRLFESGLTKMGPYPPRYCGLERDALVTAARQHQRWTSEILKRNALDQRLAAEDYPKIELLPDWTSRVPQDDHW